MPSGRGASCPLQVFAAPRASAMKACKAILHIWSPRSPCDLCPSALPLRSCFALWRRPAWHSAMPNSSTASIGRSSAPNIRASGWQSNIVKKFAKPVRVYVDDRSGMRPRRRGRTFRAFATEPDRRSRRARHRRAGRANFRVFVVDRSDYRRSSRARSTAGRHRPSPRANASSASSRRRAGSSAPTR